jgi:hypothetical protein
LKSVESRLTGLAVTAVMVCAVPMLLAMTVSRNIVTGTLTAPSNGGTLVLDNHLYRIRPGSPAVEAARKLQTGTVVDAMLNGPANASASEVLYVRQHSAK